MPWLVRKISRSKWLRRNILDGESPSADAITADLRTKREKLSVWEISSKEEINEVALAIASAGTNLDKIDLVLVNFEQLARSGLKLEKTKGLTPYGQFSEQHRDITELDYVSLGKIATEIIESFKMDSVVGFTLFQLKEIIKKGLEDNKLYEGEINSDILKKVKKTLRQ